LRVGARGGLVRSTGLSVNRRVKEPAGEAVHEVGCEDAAGFLLRGLLCLIGRRNGRARLVLEGNLAGVEHLLEDLQALFLLIVLEALVGLQESQPNRDVVLLVQQELGCEVLDLRVQQPERSGIGELQVVQDVDGQFLVRLPHFLDSMRVRAVPPEPTHSFLLEVLALLRLEVVVRNVQHLVLHLDRQRLKQVRYS
jgi:hypothetical protein